MAAIVAVIVVVIVAACFQTLFSTLAYLVSTLCKEDEREFYAVQSNYRSRSSFGALVS